ncbi:MAG: DUF3181 family protein [Gloeomargarita sp. SKYBB_i_bin120]|nr:DUF3181 family protein [Gloeomargarita sp. SKYG98]MCS7292286.1 DUF3181 family protein [Gloeomargarita sp. SKYB120]MDW8177847.1 DUF3181 family protein [Gloeomargarita sp. SKYBB_i_bin120]
MSNPEVTEIIERLAADLGDRVYMDIARWHLYLRDAKLDKVLAQRIYEQVQKGPLREEQALALLREIPVEIGGGRRQIPLLDLIPMQGQLAYMDIVEAFQKRQA